MKFLLKSGNLNDLMSPDQKAKNAKLAKEKEIQEKRRVSNMQEIQDHLRRSSNMTDVQQF